MTRAINACQSTQIAKRTVLRAAGYLTLAATILACSDSPSSKQDPDRMVAEPVTLPEPIEPGLIVNQGFAFREGTETLERPWTSTQHAGPQSYRYEVNDGALKLIRIGEEPWGQVFQRVAVSEHGGERLRFSAWLSASLDNSFEPWSESTGIAVSVFTTAPGPMGTGGTRFAFSEDNAVPIELGDYGWARHDVEFDLPENARWVDVRIRLTRGGWIKAKYPSLQILESNSEETP